MEERFLVQGYPTSIVSCTQGKVRFGLKASGNAYAIPMAAAMMVPFLLRAPTLWSPGLSAYTQIGLAYLITTVNLAVLCVLEFDEKNEEGQTALMLAVRCYLEG